LYGASEPFGLLFFAEHLLAVPDKPAVLIPKQTVLCVECRQGFFLLNDAKLVGDPFAV
jgi:hypothetical protein